MAEERAAKETTVRRLGRATRNALFIVVGIGMLGAFGLLLVGLGFYQFGYRPLPTETEKVEMAPWASSENMALTGNVLRIASLNLNYAGGSEHLDVEEGRLHPVTRGEVEARLDRLAEFVREHRIDVLVLQEIDFGSPFAGDLDQAAYLARQLKYGYVARVRHMKHPYLPFPNPLLGRVLGPVDAGLAVVSRVAIQENQRFALPPVTLSNWWSTSFAPVYCLQKVKLVVPGRQIPLFNTYLTAFDIMDRERQARTVATLVNQESPGDGLLVGTINAAPRDIRIADPEKRADNTLALVRHKLNFKLLFGSLKALDDPATYATYRGVGELKIVDYILPEKGLSVSQFTLLKPPADVTPHMALYVQVNL